MRKFTEKYYANASSAQLEQDKSELIGINEICQQYIDANKSSFLGCLSMKGEKKKNERIIARINAELERRSR